MKLEINQLLSNYKMMMMELLNENSFFSSKISGMIEKQKILIQQLVEASRKEFSKKNENNKLKVHEESVFESCDFF